MKVLYPSSKSPRRGELRGDKRGVESGDVVSGVALALDGGRDAVCVEHRLDVA
jgi:hypothetical protein